MTTFVETIAATPLWSRWGVRFIATHRPGSAFARVRAFATGLGRFLREMGSDRPAVVHLHMAKNGSFFRKSALVWLASARGVPVVLHMHGGEFQVFHDRMPAPVRWFVRATLRRAGRVVALGDRWSERLRLMAPGARVVAIPNPVRIAPAVRQPSGEAPVHVVFLGKMCAAKGTFVLLQAWAELVADRAGRCRLTLAGNGEVDRTRQVVAERGLGSSVEVLSWLGPDEVARLLDSAHVLVLPSRNEGQPMSILEAMARGVCVVATDVGGIPDLVEDGVSARLLSADDPAGLAKVLGEVVDDADLRARLGTAGRDRAKQQFDVDGVWRRIEGLYDEVTSSVNS